MAVNNPYQAYQNNSITTATPGELTLLLYNGCLKFIHQAKLAIEKKNLSESNLFNQKAQAIISELRATLDESQEISQNMMVLYEYISRQLVEANIKNDRAILAEVEGLVTEFRDTWKQVIQLNRQQQYNTSGGQA
jgi:flagellar protein FliS